MSIAASFDPTGNVVIVTGGARGIGAALARAVGSAGGHAAVFDRDPAEELEGCTGVSQHAVDVADRDAVVTAVDEVVARYGRVDGLVAGAAIQPRTPVADMDPEEWRNVLAVNLDGVVWSCQAVLPTMRRQRSGSIVVYTSGLASAGRSGASAYAASKGALVGYAKSLAAEVAADRIRVNIISPGVIDTPQFRAANPPQGEREHWERTTGIGEPGDVVGPLLFLLSDAATMTGSLLTRERAYAKEAPGE